MEDTNKKNVEINRKHDLRILAQIQTQLHEVIKTADRFSRDAEKETKILVQNILSAYGEAHSVEKEI